MILMLLALVGVAVSLLLLAIKMIKKTPKKKAFIALIVSMVLFFVGVSLMSNEDTTENKTEQTTNEPVEKTTQEPLPDAVEKTYSNDKESLQDLFETLFPNMTVENLSVGKVGEDGGNYVVSYYPTDTTWNESSFIRENISNYINYCREAYKIDGVTDIHFEISTMMVDAKGNEKLSSVQSIWMNKEEFSTFNWDKLEYQRIYDVFKSSCDIFWIDPGIEQKIDTEKIYYAA